MTLTCSMKLQTGLEARLMLLNSNTHLCKDLSPNNLISACFPHSLAALKWSPLPPNCCPLSTSAHVPRKGGRSHGLVSKMLRSISSKWSYQVTKNPKHCPSHLLPYRCKMHCYKASVEGQSRRVTGWKVKSDHRLVPNILHITGSLGLCPPNLCVDSATGTSQLICSWILLFKSMPRRLKRTDWRHQLCLTPSLHVMDFMLCKPSEKIHISFKSSWQFVPILAGSRWGSGFKENAALLCIISCLKPKL